MHKKRNWFEYEMIMKINRNYSSTYSAVETNTTAAEYAICVYTQTSVIDLWIVIAFHRMSMTLKVKQKWIAIDRYSMLNGMQIVIQTSHFSHLLLSVDVPGL